MEGVGDVGVLFLGFTFEFDFVVYAIWKTGTWERIGTCHSEMCVHVSAVLS